MSESLIVEVDAADVLAALAALPAAAAAAVKDASEVTAKAIADGTDRRFARRAAGPTRGGHHTAEGITIEETRDGGGFLVYVKSPQLPRLPTWLEFGTKYSAAHPALFPAARLEERAHLRRVSDALEHAIADTGLGG